MLIFIVELKVTMCGGIYFLNFWCTENGRPTLNLERRLDHDGHPLAITAADAVTGSGVSPWNWRETPGTG